MARVKVCRLCGEHNGPDELFCVGADCGTSLADIGVVDTSWLGTGTTGSRSGGAGDCDAHGAGEGRQPSDIPGGRTVRDSRTVQAPHCALVFPWGRVPVLDRLSVGREAGFSPISSQLDVFSTVSRRHAVVVAAQGRWSVSDLDSTNGTYLNGVRLAAGEARVIDNGDQIGFSRSLQVGVEIAVGEGGRGATGR